MTFTFPLKQYFEGDPCLTHNFPVRLHLDNFRHGYRFKGIGNECIPFDLEQIKI